MRESTCCSKDAKKLPFHRLQDSLKTKGLAEPPCQTASRSLNFAVQLISAENSFSGMWENIFTFPGHRERDKG